MDYVTNVHQISLKMLMAYAFAQTIWHLALSDITMKEFAKLHAQMAHLRMKQQEHVIHAIIPVPNVLVQVQLIVLHATLALSNLMDYV